MNEWAFAGEIKSWWDQEFHEHPNWGMQRCQIEDQMEGDRHRSDITIKGPGNDVLAAGELRLPDHPQAGPYHPDNLRGAIDKALAFGASWAFTSDGWRTVLINVNRPGRPQERIVDVAEGAFFDRRTQLDSPAFLNGEVREGWVATLARVAPIIAGLAEPEGMAPDEVFIESLRALLSAPVATVRSGLDARRQREVAFADQLVVWMVDQQGWVHDPSQWNEELQRTARLSCYVFTTRLMFYEALRRAKPELERLRLPEVSATVARAMFRAWFDEAREKSGDYRTLFDWDEANAFALVSDDAVAGWVRVLSHLETFDLSTLGYDIVGKIFERLIEPVERYRWGQHYTQPDVVDLMLAFAIPDGSGAVLDPAAGGGTFLVRAYERKAKKNPTGSHQQRLSHIYGVDISSFAATLATINLAVRRLEFEDNYPQVIAQSFFRVSPDHTFMRLPGPGVNLEGDEVEVRVEPITAVVCNPPYVRRQELSVERLREARAILDAPSDVIPHPRSLSRLANYHVYFWPAAARFLMPGGRLAFITSGEWMDSDYGVSLQLWLLSNFCIEART